MGGETLLFCVSVKQWAAVIGQAWLVIGHVCVGGVLPWDHSVLGACGYCS